MINTRHVAYIKQAELLSSFGAGVLGAGIALLFANILAAYAFPIMLFGLISHSVGMFQKHRLEPGSNIRIWWAEASYWICWLALVALLLYIIMRQF